MAQPRTDLGRYPCNNCSDDSDSWIACRVWPGSEACTGCVLRGLGTHCVFGDKAPEASWLAATDNAYGDQTRRASRSDDASMATNTQSSTRPGISVSGGTVKNDAGGEKVRDSAGAATSANQGRHQTKGDAKSVADDEFHAEFNTPIVDVVDRRHRDSQLMTVEQMEKEFNGF